MLSRDSNNGKNAPPKPSSRRVKGASKNCTPLLELALKGGKPQKIGQLLKDGANINGVDIETGHTFLHIVAIYNNEPLASECIKLGGEVNGRSADGSTPLHLACLYDSIEIVKLLLFRGADLNLGDNSLSTPLHIAARRGSTSCVQMLLASGARIDLADRNGKLVIHELCQNGDVEALRTLLKLSISSPRSSSHNLSSVNSVTTAGNSPLHIAVISDHINIVEALLEHSEAPIDFEIRNQSSKTPYELALQLDRRKLAEMIQKAQQSKRGASPPSPSSSLPSSSSSSLDPIAKVSPSSPPQLVLPPSIPTKVPLVRAKSFGAAEMKQIIAPKKNDTPLLKKDRIVLPITFALPPVRVVKEEATTSPRATEFTSVQSEDGEKNTEWNGPSSDPPAKPPPPIPSRLPPLRTNAHIEPPPVPPPRSSTNTQQNGEEEEEKPPVPPPRSLVDSATAGPVPPPRSDSLSEVVEEEAPAPPPRNLALLTLVEKRSRSMTAPSVPSRRSAPGLAQSVTKEEQPPPPPPRRNNALQN